MHPNIDLINPREYDFTVTLLRSFFRKRGFVETPVQHRLSVLAACEDPRTIGTFNYAGELWPLPQTGQMWLEYELLTQSKTPGYYCISTSYRNEPDPIPGRHNLIFPMFEFETRGNVRRLIKLMKDLLEYIGFKRSEFIEKEYVEMTEKYEAKELTAEYEKKIHQDFGSTVFLTLFPQHTSPFWNMKKSGDFAHKVDVILHGIETIGSAERSTDPNEMRWAFHTISDGVYADILYAQFGKERVEKELEEFLDLDFFTRCGGGIGITRMIRALKLNGTLKENSYNDIK